MVIHMVGMVIHMVGMVIHMVGMVIHNQVIQYLVSYTVWLC
jgi:hypothetical protein